MTSDEFAHPIIYLASPYSHVDPKIRRQRFEQATRAAAKLIRKGQVVFSPVTMTHPIDELLAGSDGSMGSDYWLAFDQAFMERCAELFVLRLDGWDCSAGVTREIQYFRSRGRRVNFIDP